MQWPAQRLLYSDFKWALIRLNSLAARLFVATWFTLISKETSSSALLSLCDGNGGFRITGPLWGQSIGHRWIALTKGPVMRNTFLYCDTIMKIQVTTLLFIRFYFDVLPEMDGAINFSVRVGRQLVVLSGKYLIQNDQMGLVSDNLNNEWRIDSMCVYFSEIPRRFRNRMHCAFL